MRTKAYTPEQIATLRRRGQPALSFALDARRAAPKTFERRLGQYAKALGIGKLELRAKLTLLDYNVHDILQPLRDAEAELAAVKALNSL